MSTETKKSGWREVIAIHAVAETELSPLLSSKELQSWRMTSPRAACNTRCCAGRTPTVRLGYSMAATESTRLNSPPRKR